MSGNDRDEDAWRTIVENYGERAQVDDLVLPPVEEPPAAYDPSLAEVDEAPADTWEPERFVPPVPPPGPGLEFPRHLPWLAVFGIPVVLLVALMSGIYLPSWLGYLLVAGFVGSFVYLVVTMNRAGRDPFDDGARL